MNDSKVSVSLFAIQTLLEWCNDAIDFEHEADFKAASSFEQLAADIHYADPAR